MLIEDMQGTDLWRITPAGQVTPVPLRGINIATGGVIIDETDGNYLIGSNRD